MYGSAFALSGLSSLTRDTEDAPQPIVRGSCASVRRQELQE